MSTRAVVLTGFRWALARCSAALPGNDFWLFDSETLVVNHFSGRGDWTETEHVTDPAIVKLCSAAFDAVWEQAIPRAKYRPA